MRNKNAIQNLTWVIQADSLEERERLLISWYERHVRQFSVDHWSDLVSEKTREFAIHVEQKMLAQLVSGVVKNNEVTKELSGQECVRNLRVIVLVDA